MGVENNEFQIPNLNSTTSFFDWFTKTNDEVIAKLNKAKIYDIDISGSRLQGVSAELGTATKGPTAGFLRFGLADSVPHGITIQGDVGVEGDVTNTGSYDVTVTVSSGVTAGLTAGRFVTSGSQGQLVLSIAAASGGPTLDPFHGNESIGVVKGVTGNNVTITTSGLFSGFTGLTAGQPYFLDPQFGKTGGYTLNVPAGSGVTKKKLFISISETEGFIQIGPSDVL
jgi:hypothetical protein